MALTEEQQLAVVKALRGKIGGRTLKCPISDDSRWQVQSELAAIPATDDLSNNAITGTRFPTAVVVCQTCGYTILLNIFSLGLADEFGVQPTSEVNVSK